MQWRHLPIKLQNKILPLNQKTLSQLKQKHSQGKEAELGVLLTDTPEQVHPIKFVATVVKRAAVRTRGGVGPSGWTLMGGEKF